MCDEVKEDLDSLEERLVARLKRWIYESAKQAVRDGSDSHLEFRASFSGFDEDDVPCLDVQIEDHSYESVDGLRVPAAKVEKDT